jgi:hypothetical protein
MILETITSIYTVPGPAGAGKTFSACRYATNAARLGDKILIVQPSVVLIDQTMRDLQKLGSGVRITALHSGDGQDRVVRRLMQHLADTDADGEILLITHAAFERITFFERRSLWHVVYDEMPQVDYSRDFKLPDNGRLVLDCFEATSYNASYSRLQISNKTRLRDIAQNAGKDEAWAIIADFAGKLLNPSYEMFVLSEQLARFRRNPECGQKHLNVFGLLQPTIFAGFASVTLMAACLSETICYRYWSQLGTKFSGHQLIKPRFDVHPNGQLLDVHYASERDWSKRLRDKQIDIDGQKASIFDTIVVRAEHLLGSEPFVWMANKDTTDCPFTNTQNPRLPNSPHGLNNFQNLHNAVILSALNPTPAHFEFLSEVAGINPDEVKDGGYRQAVYQACGRISLRDLKSTQRKKVVVMDKATADWLAALFPGSRVQALPGDDYAPCEQKRGRKPMHKSDAARVAAFKAKRKSDLIKGLDEVNQFGETKLLYIDEYRSSRIHQGSFFSTKRSSTAFADTYGVSDEDLISLMREEHAREIPCKDFNHLICPASFDPDQAAETDRGLANIVSLRGIWLDNDGGDLSYDEFALMFPALRMVIYNTFSSTAVKPRWRVFVPTTCMMTIDAHREIIDQIKHRLMKREYYGTSYIKKHSERAGTIKAHDFDESKFSAASMFFFPAQAQNPADSFFIEYAEGREPLNPYMWIDKTVLDHRPEPERPARAEKNSNSGQTIRSPAANDDGPSSNRAQPKQQRIDAAIAAWRGAAAGEGNFEFNRLAWKLHAAGLDTSEVEGTLRCEANYARSPADRKAQIPAVVDNLRRHAKQKTG